MIYHGTEQRHHRRLGQILGLTAEEVRRRVAVAGDNKRKDGGMAEQNGCPFVHTQYGVRPLDDSSLQQVLRFAPRTVGSTQYG